MSTPPKRLPGDRDTSAGSSTFGPEIPRSWSHPAAFAALWA